jgi:HlyD family secretion protein
MKSTIHSTAAAYLSIRRNLFAAAAAGAVLVGGAGAWATTMQISGAVIASGTVVVDSSSRKVQHPTGGVVGRLFVRDGDTVQGGDVLIRLDDTVTRANLAVITNNLDESRALKARLEAEREGRDRITFPKELEARRGESELSRVLDGEGRVFELARRARDGQKAQLTTRRGQLEQELSGLVGQANSKAAEMALIEKELVGVRQLEGKGLVTTQRTMQLERESTRLDGERNQLIAAAAQTRGKIAETDLQSLQIDQDMRSDVARQLREVDAKIAELGERRIAAQDQLTRIDIRAPAAGRVHELQVHTEGGVVAAGEVLMMIVPEAETLTAELHVMPQDIDQVKEGQTATIRLPAFNQRVTPEISGTVARVAPDATTDQRSGRSYYTVRASISADSLAEIEGLKLVPGMPVEAFITTRERTVLSYLVKPLTEIVEKSFRED